MRRIAVGLPNLRAFSVLQASAEPQRVPQTRPHSWTFITNRAQVLLALAQRRGARVHEIAAAAEITERYACSILGDLQDAGYVERRRVGRSNRDRVHPDLPLGDPVVEHNRLGELLRLIA